jgi:hypothetical protein
MFRSPINSGRNATKRHSRKIHDTIPHRWHGLISAFVAERVDFSISRVNDCLPKQRIGHFWGSIYFLYVISLLWSTGAHKSLA